MHTACISLHLYLYLGRYMSAISGEHTTGYRCLHVPTSPTSVLTNRHRASPRKITNRTRLRFFQLIFVVAHVITWSPIRSGRWYLRGESHSSMLWEVALHGLRCCLSMQLSGVGLGLGTPPRDCRRNVIPLNRGRLFLPPLRHPKCPS